MISTDFGSGHLPVLQKLLNKILKDTSIGRPLENSGENDPILRIGRQYLIPLTPVKARNLNWCHPNW
jgi:hypothetical protein